MKIKDEEIVTLVLNSVPTSYKIFVTSLYVSDRTVTFEELARLLMQEELRNKKQDKEETSDQALIARGKGKMFMQKGKAQQSNAPPSEKKEDTSFATNQVI